MEDSKTLFCILKFPWARERISSKLVDNLGRVFQKVHQLWYKVKSTLEQTMKAQRGEYRYSSTLSLTSTIDGAWVVDATPRPLSPGKEIWFPFAEEGVWASRLVKTGAKDLAPIGIRSPDRPGRNE